MRYRPYTSTGLSSSAITLSLRAGPVGAGRLQAGLHRAGMRDQQLQLRCGRHWRGRSAASGHRPWSDRRVLILMLRLDLDGAPFERQTRTALSTSGATYLDALLLDQPAPGVLSQSEFADLGAIRRARLATRLALAGDAPITDEYMPLIDFDVLAIRYNICAGWPERNLLKHAAERGMTILGYGPHIDPTRAPPPASPVDPWPGPTDPPPADGEP